MMDNLQVLEQHYKEYTKNLMEWIPDGIIHVDLGLLQKLDLLDDNSTDVSLGLTRYFNVIETFEKITLINEQFVIWIVPEMQNNQLVTYTLIALNNDKGPKLELAFATSGVYNSSKLVLRVLEKFLVEIQENEQLMQDYG
ncbi:MAG: hypothetical protein WC222_00420 [Parachlamydiales bacterium]